ncbi:MAG: S-layer protein [Planctomycetaceae bacterium]|nr:S-layer protein [Planctomycetaceae bacterium]
MRRIVLLLSVLCSFTASPVCAADPAPTFERDIQPILTRAGCNSGPCHGKARGQNGFQLSLLAFDHDFDYNAIVTEARGRRIFPANSTFSLLLRKASGLTPHGGGKKIHEGDAAYRTLERWIAAGCPRTPADAPHLLKVTVSPDNSVMVFKATQQLTVTAHYSDGTKRDVTALSQFSSSESVYAAVDANGLVKAGPIPGEATIMARFAEKFAVCPVLIPLPTPVPPAVYEALPRANFIDGHVWAKLQKLNLTPSESANDATFHRRAFLDVIGRLPTPDEVRAFLAEKNPKKRERLIEALLQRPEYGDFWANKWTDLLRPNAYHVGIKATYNLDQWLRQSFRKNQPYDQFVRELIAAKGSTFTNGAVVMYRDRREPGELTTLVSQLFLGVRLDCAKCHHHPFEVWGQDDFYSFAAFFGRIGRKGTGISAPISGSEETIYLGDGTGGKRNGSTVKHPLTGKEMTPTPLLGQPLDIPPERDPRDVLADWVTAPENPFFAKVIVNRVWADLMGRGIVDPVDDIRATNPASNPALLDALAADFRKNKYDLKSLIKTITASHAYGLATTPNDRNAADLRNYSRHYRQRLRAEVLLDMVSDVTGVPERFEAMPPGSRAMEVWTARAQSVFLDSFGRPDPNADPPCERTPDTTVVQALHLMNAPNLYRKVTDDAGRCATLAKSAKTPAEIVDELYLLAYGRMPTDTESTAAVKRFEKPSASRRAATEDLMWALINTPEFVFND